MMDHCLSETNWPCHRVAKAHIRGNDLPEGEAETHPQAVGRDRRRKSKRSEKSPDDVVNQSKQLDFSPGGFPVGIMLELSKD